VQGVNVARRHQRQTAAQQGGIIAKELPIHISNLAHIDPKDGKETLLDEGGIGSHLAFGPRFGAFYQACRRRSTSRPGAVRRRAW
jgi:hypothetical protein